jgi:hypothetical protein
VLCLRRAIREYSADADIGIEKRTLRWSSMVVWCIFEPRTHVPPGMGGGRSPR